MTLDGKTFFNTNQGLMQGSKLSPLLFNIFIDDFITTLEQNGFKALAFADDVVIYIEKITATQNAVKLVKKWMEENRLTINAQKSGLLRILSR